MTRRRAVTVVVIWLLVSVSLLASDADPAVPVLAGLIAAIATAVFVVVDVVVPAPTVDWHRGTRARARTARTDRRVAKLRRDARAAANADGRAMRVRLVALVDDALSTRHDIDRAADPTGADALLTPRLHDLVTGSSRSVTSVREIERTLIDIEAL